MSIGGLFALYGAGLLTFASPCVLPLLPVYLALLGGTAASGTEEGGPGHAGRLRRAGLGFAVGLSAVFVLLGVGASFAAAPLMARGRALAIVAGVAMIVFGLQLLEVFKLRALQADRRPLLERVPTPGGFGGGVLFGAAFAVGWTPCVGPVLGAALTYAASTSANPWLAGLQLAAYAAGLATPLVAAALAASKVVPRLRKLARSGARLQRGMGALLVLVGVLFASGRLDVVAPKVAATRAVGPSAASPECATSPSASACGATIVEGVAPGAALTGKPRLVEFVSDHCVVCARMAPVLDDLVRVCDASDAVLRVRLEDPSGAGLASRYGVRVVPTLVSVDAAGAEVERRVGEQSRDELSRAIREVRGRACGG
jgi:cytochrome c-type biogenesis protein